MKGKTSFTAYCDWIETFEELSNEEAGKLVKHILRYVNDQDPEAPDRTTKLLFAPIKASLKRDLKKWLKTVERNRSNGSLGGRPKSTQVNPSKPTGLSGNPKNPNKPDSDSDSDSDSVSDTDRGSEGLSFDLIRSIKEIEKDYLKNDRLIEAVLTGRDSPFTDRSDLEKKLSEFCEHLRSIDETAKSEKDFKRHFLNWSRKKKDFAQKEKPKRHKLSMEDLQITKEDLEFKNLNQ